MDEGKKTRDGGIMGESRVGNRNLNVAKKTRNDEFYTRYEDIERELVNYWDDLRGKRVLLNCDTKESNFYKYFKDYFHEIGIESVTATSFRNGVDSLGGIKVVYDGQVEVEEHLSGGGSFDSEEVLEELGKSDIVVTNPPFSLFRNFIDVLVESRKKFVVIGSLNAVTYKNVFPLIKEGRLFFGTNNVNKFNSPEGEEISFGNIVWYTNIEQSNKRKLELRKTYKEGEYKFFDGYNVLNVDRVEDIPKDFMGVMGVPITYLKIHDPEKFNILGIANDVSHMYYEMRTVVGGKSKYRRVIIGRKKGE